MEQKEAVWARRAVPLNEELARLLAELPREEIIELVWEARDLIEAAKPFLPLKYQLGAVLAMLLIDKLCPVPEPEGAEQPPSSED